MLLGVVHKKEYAVYARENDDNYGRPLRLRYFGEITSLQKSSYCTTEVVPKGALKPLISQFTTALVAHSVISRTHTASSC